MPAPPLLVIAGATATGKTGLSLGIARALRVDGIPAEIISADSRQVYRGLDIGTAKVSAAERGEVPHHGIDLVDPDASFSVADFVRHARDALERIGEGRGLAILVGGTGLYLRAVTRGLDPDGLPSDLALRRRIDAALVKDGLEATTERLKALAPTLAGRIDLRNPRRVSRALEIAELAGDRPLPAPAPYAGPIAWIGLRLEPTIQAEWIATRARAQFDAGLIEEAAALRSRWDPTLPAFSAIGYHEAWAVLDDEINRETAIEQDAARNVAFAKRQRTWFRAEPDIAWLDAGADDASTQLETGLSIARRLLPA